MPDADVTLCRNCGSPGHTSDRYIPQ
ncbi:MAG: hypothetical protein K6A40_08610 [Solobacterium sp.]|nr:hypothetical protein [Solobacterium sp.]